MGRSYCKAAAATGQLMPFLLVIMVLAAIRGTRFWGAQNENLLPIILYINFIIIDWIEGGKNLDKKYGSSVCAIDAECVLLINGRNEPGQWLQANC